MSLLVIKIPNHTQTQSDSFSSNIFIAENMMESNDIEET